MLKNFIIFLLILSPPFALAERRAAPWVGYSFKDIPCSGQNWPSHDYTDAKDRQKTLAVVESYHFTKEIEYHIRGKSGSIPQELDYTLKTFANHTKALLSAIRYQIKLNNNLLKKKLPLVVPVECYFQRAIHYNPKVSSTFSLYAYYQKKMGRLKESDKYYQKALTISPENAKNLYSYSLLLIKLKQYDKAVEYAQKAYENGNPPPILKEKLIKLGKWKD